MSAKKRVQELFGDARYANFTFRPLDEIKEGFFGIRLTIYKQEKSEDLIISVVEMVKLRVSNNYTSWQYLDTYLDTYSDLSVLINVYLAHFDRTIIERFEKAMNKDS